MISVDLTPFIPLSLKERGRKNRKEGLTPLLDSLGKLEGALPLPKQSVTQGV
jgi:hypothetical protein